VDRQPPLPQYRAGRVPTEVPLVNLEELAEDNSQVAA